MAPAGINENSNTGLWHECAATVNKLENIVVNPHKQIAYEKFYRKIPYYAKHWRDFWEKLVMHTIFRIKVKLKYQGMTCIFIGFAQNHTGGRYQMLNIWKKLSY